MNTFHHHYLFSTLFSVHIKVLYFLCIFQVYINIPFKLKHLAEVKVIIIKPLKTIGMSLEDQFGFLFAFKIYVDPTATAAASIAHDHAAKSNHNQKKSLFSALSSSSSCLSSLESSEVLVDSLENFVHKITHSDIIHVEIIPVVGGQQNHMDDNHSQHIILQISPTAYSAYVGIGFNEHDSSFCMTDPSYKLVYIPMEYEKMMEGIHFLESQRGKQYNYLALPLTILPTYFKKRNLCLRKKKSFMDQSMQKEGNVNGDMLCHDLQQAVIEPPLHANQKIASTLLHPSKVFCSQMGLTICYLCDVFSGVDFGQGKDGDGGQFLDPMCCTPSELYNLLSHCGHVAMEWPKTHVCIH